MIGPDDLLDFGLFDVVLEKSQVSARRAISAAYYAVFHAIAQAGAAAFAGSRGVQQPLARSYDHGAVLAMAERIELDAKSKQIDPRLVLIARNLKELRRVRERADYDLDASFTRSDADDHLLRAVKACAALREIKADHGALDYPILPLLRDRSRRG